FATHEIFRPRGQRKMKRQRSCRLNCRRDALGRELKFIQRAILVTGRVLDRATDKPYLGRNTHGLSRCIGAVTKSTLQVCRHRKIGRVDDRAGTGERLVTGKLAITPAKSRRGRTTRGGKRFKTEPGEDARRTGVPRVWN